MIVGIDASNIRAGGGITHLRELLAAAEPERDRFARVVVWAPQPTLDALPERDWLDKVAPPALAGGLWPRTRWQAAALGGAAEAAGCDLLFVPGGSFVTGFRPVVTMNQNLLPFQWRELRRYGLSAMTLKLLALRRTQSRSFRAADATIFLTDYAREVVTAVTGPLRGAAPVVPHGVDPRFFAEPRPARRLEACSEADPLRLVYVSAVEPYKHQWHVAEAVAELRGKGLPVALDLIGPANPRVLPRLQRTLGRLDPQGKAIRYLGPVPHAELHRAYQAADIAVFASSCETIANILIEGMAAGLPTASSDIGAMREVLGEAGVYFDPERPGDIAAAIERLALSPELRERNARLAHGRARGYSWSRCARETFGVFDQVRLASAATM
jgi:glycosyltransferase involved in cell wall biosynthesis